MKEDGGDEEDMHEKIREGESSRTAANNMEVHCLLPPFYSSFFPGLNLRQTLYPRGAKKLMQGWVILASFFVLQATCRLFIIQHSLFAEDETERPISREEALL